MKTKFNMLTRTFTSVGFVLIALMLLSFKLSAQNQKGCCATIYKPDTIQSVSVKELSNEYRRLSRKPCEECSSWLSSGLFQVMTELGKRLEGKSKADIKKVMGKPDEIKENQWIYDWRDGHDYLFFEFTDGRAKAQWYYALE